MPTEADECKGKKGKPRLVGLMGEPNRRIYYCKKKECNNFEQVLFSCYDVGNWGCIILCRDNREKRENERENLVEEKIEDDYKTFSKA